MFAEKQQTLTFKDRSACKCSHFWFCYSCQRLSIYDAKMGICIPHWPLYLVNPWRCRDAVMERGVGDLRGFLSSDVGNSVSHATYLALNCSREQNTVTILHSDQTS